MSYIPDAQSSPPYPSPHSPSEDEDDENEDEEDDTETTTTHTTTDTADSAPAAAKHAGITSNLQASPSVSIPPTHSTQRVDISIPKIKPFPKPANLSSTTGAGAGTGDNPQSSEPPPPLSPRSLAENIDGKYVDEFGNILDWDGTVLGRVEGDLPTMVGRPVTASGEIFDVDGEVAGHVSENFTLKPDPAIAAAAAAAAEAAKKKKLRPLAGELKTDEEGNIYNGDGNIIGKLNQDMIRAEEARRDGEGGNGATGGTEGEGKTGAKPSPSEVFLDIKSTHDGIQLIIKIPTVFNKGASG